MPFGGSYRRFVDLLGTKEKKVHEAQREIL